MQSLYDIEYIAYENELMRAERYMDSLYGEDDDYDNQSDYDDYLADVGEWKMEESWDMQFIADLRVISNHSIQN